MRLYQFSVLAALLATAIALPSGAVWAQTTLPEKPIPQTMNTLSVEEPDGGWMHPQVREQKAKSATDYAEEKKKKEDEAEDKAEEESDRQLIPLEKPDLTTVTKLKPWRKGDELFTAGRNEKRARAVLKSVDAEGENIPPSGLLQAARMHAELGNMERAARYYYAAQLRARFDYLRWPIKGADSPHKRLTVDVQEGVARKIGRWATASSERLARVMDDVRVWDLATPYSYHPGYRIPLGRDIPKEEHWPDLLSAARAAFFQDAGNITQALRGMGR